jgi:tetratricopeptide (TPR) repeat protein
MNGNRFQRAQFYADRGRHAAAVREYEALLSELPDNAFVQGLLALQLAEIGEYERAKFHAQEGMRCAPDCGFSHFAMGSVDYKSGQFKLASESIEAAVRLEPEKPSYWQTLASIRFSQGRRRSALNAIESCLRLAPDNLGAHNLRAALLRMQCEHAEADRATTRALEIAPENSLAHVNLGLSHIAKGHYQQAFEEFDEAFRLDPNSRAAGNGVLQARSARAITILYFYMLLVGGFLLWVASHGPASGCGEVAIAFTLVFVVLLVMRHLWPLLSRSP